MPQPRLHHLALPAAEGETETAPLDANASAVDEDDKNMASGTILRWNPDKGFGFIRPDEGGEELFLHIRSLDPSKLAKTDKGPVQPSFGDRVKYVRVYDERRQRYQADKANIVAPGPGDNRTPMMRAFSNMEASPWGELTGRCSSWYPKKGFGFVRPVAQGEPVEPVFKGVGAGNRPPQRSEEIFVHFSRLIGVERLVEGDEVSYNLKTNERTGKPEAVDVRYTPKRAPHRYYTSASRLPDHVGRLQDPPKPAAVAAEASA